MELRQCCRTCLALLDLNPIFQMQEHHETYSQVILEATGVQINFQDSLPQQMCNSCIDSINTAYRFRKKCRETQKTLSEQIYNHIPNVMIEEIHRQSKQLSFIDINDLIDINDYVKVTISEVKIEPDEYDSDGTKEDNNSIEKTNVTESQENSEAVNEISGIRNDENEKDKTEKDKMEKDKTEKDKMEKDKTEKNKTEKNKTEKNKTEKKKTEKDKTEREKGEMCEYCQKVLKTKSSLRNHYKIHKELNLVCEHCGKKFNSPRRLLIHCKAKHGYEKTDKCSYCDYRGSSPDQVKIHERLHTGEKPYVCAQCGAGFHRTSSYLQHVAIHLPEKTVQCKQCPARFKSVTLMRIHANRHREESQYTYKCVVCAHFFKRHATATRHLQRIHSMQPLPEHIERTKCF